MGKFGVGVGEDFPLDEEAGRGKPPPEDEEPPCCGPDDWRRQRDLRREAWRRFRRQMREEWRAHRRAFHRRCHEPGTVEPMDDERGARLHHLLIGALAVIGLAALFGSRHRR